MTVRLFHEHGQLTFLLFIKIYTFKDTSQIVHARMLHWCVWSFEKNLRRLGQKITRMCKVYNDMLGKWQQNITTRKDEQMSNNNNNNNKMYVILLLLLFN